MTERDAEETEHDNSLLRLARLLSVSGIAFLCCGIELVLQAADHGLIGTGLWRPLAYQYGAFWSGLLSNWRPNFDLQPYTMFLTYGFLHGGLGHLLGNMLALFYLADLVSAQTREGRFIFVYAVSILGGALGFALVNEGVHPMVGASGALFGLAGAWQYDQYVELRKAGLRPYPVLRVAFGLVILNILMWFAMGGVIAWETHLFGFLSGWVAAALWRAVAAWMRPQQ